MSSRPRIHGRKQLKSRREDSSPPDASYSHLPVLDRLAERLQRDPVELGELVEKQDAIVRQSDFPWREMRAAADHGGVRDRVMWRAEWTPANEASKRCPSRHRRHDRP